MSVTFRTGRKEDCPKLAELVYVASDGVVEFLYHDLIDGVSPIQMVAHNLEKDTGYYTYKNTIVAEEKSGVIGVSFYYPARYHVVSDEMNGIKTLRLFLLFQRRSAHDSGRLPATAWRFPAYLKQGLPLRAEIWISAKF